MKLRKGLSLVTIIAVFAVSSFYVGRATAPAFSTQESLQPSQSSAIFNNSGADVINVASDNSNNKDKTKEFKDSIKIP